ncbi:hypothetical protein LIT38_10360 [Bacillus sp. CMF12]|uniref:hypothetical protein n=1 Tax=Bacillaceae TaxID=186817 RepID=UPI001FB1C411|nr:MULTISPECIES: hypothetical protein [Bacillaceae]UOE57353.1 hypothetical protein IRB79_11665 [Cytobacillus oceanisediminis]USK51812.1 hypothetical protein LIT38_10360 [Bacillus sp. CMF12]
MDLKNDACLTNEAVLIQSVICSKKVKLIAYVNTSLRKTECTNIQFIPDLTTIQINGTLMKDLIIIQGFIKGSVIVDGKCVKKTTLSFQEEVMCENICPGDTLKHTTPVLEGVLPPQVIPHEGHEGGRIVFKAIFSIQATVIREKLGTISVSIIGDINENRCKPAPQPTLIVSCEEDKKTCGNHHRNDYESEEDFPCLCEEFESSGG